MNEEQLVAFLRGNLRVTIEVGNGRWHGKELQVRVMLGDELISSSAVNTEELAE